MEKGFKKFSAPMMLIIYFAIVLLPTPSPIEAQNPSVFDDIKVLTSKAGGASNLASKDPREITARIIKVFLGLLGTIFLILILYGGYLWMTAQGEEEQVTKAKDLIRNAIIGLIIVLAAYTITQFVIQKGALSTGLPPR